ncbi:hypothetical protein TTY48_20900 [Tsukamurella sp. TY48]|nr:hypothetical protein TTY48_20900 [Tsukamurella sp. TY48]
MTWPGMAVGIAWPGIECALIAPPAIVPSAIGCPAGAGAGIEPAMATMCAVRLAAKEVPPTNTPRAVAAGWAGRNMVEYYSL